VADDIGRSVEWIPVCPELEIGLGVPREAIELVGDPETPELIATESRRVLTGTMQTWAAQRLDELDRHELSGYVLKARSPSCGPRGVPVYGATTQPTGTGLFARALADRFPNLPIVDETDLSTPEAIARFLSDVNAYFCNCRLR